MKNTMKKILSIALIILMLCSCIPLNAMATGDYVTDEDISYNSTNALGDILSDAIDENEDAIEDDNGYGIYNVTLSELIATAYLSSPEDSTLVVAIYDEDTNKMVTSGKAKVNPNMESVEVTLADCEMPDYYIIKAFILDVENAPVCDMYQNNEHTKLYEEFFEKTIFDFDEEKVINLDAGIDSNFVVVSDDAEVIEQKENENIVIEDDYENGIFKFENANSDITSLKSGDILYYVYGDGEEDYILTKIGSIETRGNVTTITAADDCDMGELFSYMDIDTSKIEEQQTYSARKSFDDEQGRDYVEKTFPLGSFEEKFGGDDNYIKLSGGATATVHLKFHYDYVLFGKDYYKFEYWIRVDANATVTLFTEKSKTFKGEIIDTYIPVITGLEIHVEVNITFTVKMSLTATGSITFSVKYGAKRDSTGKQEKIVSPPDLKLNIDISGKYEISIVPKLVTGFKILKVFHVDLNIPVTFKTEGTVYFRTPTSDLTTHSCKICADGDVKYKVTFNITVKFGLKRLFMKEIIDYDVKEKEKLLGVYYISIDDNNEIMFGWGECPNNLESDNFCGENARWKITQDGELVIFGEGEMEDYSGSNAPWYKYRTSINSVIVENGITHVGKYAFSNLNKLKNAEISNTVESIGSYAFYQSEIETIVLGEKIKNIDYCAFNFCDELVSITIPESVEMLGRRAFSFCEKLETVVLGNGLKEIDESTFESCKKLKNITFGEGITNIGFHAFDDCNSLENIVIPDSVISLGSGAFCSCDNLKKINLGTSVETLAYSVFKDCKKLSEVKIPASLRRFEIDTFENCIGIKKFIVDTENPYYSNDENGVLYDKDKKSLKIYPAGCSLETFEIPEGISEIERYSFENSENLKKIVFPITLEKIGVSAFNGCTNLTNICYKGNALQWDNISKSGSKLPDVPIRFNYDGTEAIMLLAFRSNSYASNSLNRVANSLTETVTSQIKNYSYIIMVVRDSKAEDLLSSDNLLFIDQKVAGDEPLTFEFMLDEEVESYEVIFTSADLHEHSYVETVIPANCEEGGYTLYTCECGDSFIDNETEANGHSLNGWYTSVTATCTTAGVEKNDCSECNYSETREVVAAGHNFDGSKCAACGYDKADSCSCKCHKSGLSKIIFKIILIFQKIFKKNRVCEGCGIYHY